MQVTSKSPISKAESFPLKLSDLVKGLEGIPQFERLDVSFWRYETAKTRAEDVKRVLSFHYSRTKAGITASTDSIALLTAPKWQAQISPVPRPLRHRVHDLLIKDALPHARKWLIDNFNKDGEFQSFWVEYRYDYGRETLVLPSKNSWAGH
jgi:hypothetical protein